MRIIRKIVQIIVIRRLTNYFFKCKIVKTISENIATINFKEFSACMKMAKSYKIITLIAAVALSLAAAFGCMNFSLAKAESSPSTFFTVSSGASMEFDGENLSAKLKNNDVLSFDNKLVADDLGLEFSYTGLTKLTLTLTADSYGANGNKNADGKYDKSIENVLVFENGSFTFNGADGYAVADGDVNVKFFVENNLLNAIVNGGAAVVGGNYYKVANVDKTAVSVSFKASAEGESEGELVLKSVDQKVSDTTGNFKQTFKMTEGTFDKTAYQRIALSDKIFNGANVVKKDTSFSVTATAYAVLGGNSKNIKILAGKDVYVGETFGKLDFGKDGTETIKIVDSSDNEQVYEEYTFEVKSGDYTAPVYNMDTAAIEAFTAAFKDRLVQKDDDGNVLTDASGKSMNVCLGSGEKLELPSMKDMVSDDFTSYENLKYTVHYSSPSTTSTTSSFEVPLTEAGDYSFYVTFIDESGNEMKAKDFVYTDDKDSNKEYFGAYKPYIFTFTVYDNADISVTCDGRQGEGYIGEDYIATGFDITATDYKTVYTLWYRANETSEWIEIPAAKNVTDKSYNVNGFTYDNVKTVGFNGDVSFTPDRVGQYKIKCVVRSTANNRLSQAETSIISVNGYPKTVKPDNHWLENNVWSVVFLSIGTLCLIGIVVLLCIKPKEDAED